MKSAWGYASQAAQDGITAGLQQFTPAWNKAFSSGAFAALACPTWMMGYIQGQAGDSYAGKWDIAPVLPGGATNWGGSWLGVPAKAAHKDAAIALVEWLSAKQQQVTMWNAGRPLPVELRRGRRSGRERRQERLLQQRAGGPDLRRHRPADEDPADRALRHPDPVRR